MNGLTQPLVGCDVPDGPFFKSNLDASVGHARLVDLVPRELPQQAVHPIPCQLSGLRENHCSIHRNLLQTFAKKGDTVRRNGNEEIGQGVCGIRMAILTANND